MTRVMPAECAIASHGQPFGKHEQEHLEDQAGRRRIEHLLPHALVDGRHENESYLRAFTVADDLVCRTPAAKLVGEPLSLLTQLQER